MGTVVFPYVFNGYCNGYCTGTVCELLTPPHPHALNPPNPVRFVINGLLRFEQVSVSDFWEIGTLWAMRSNNALRNLIRVPVPPFTPKFNIESVCPVPVNPILKSGGGGVKTVQSTSSYASRMKVTTPDWSWGVFVVTTRNRKTRIKFRRAWFKKIGDISAVGSPQRPFG